MPFAQNVRQNSAIVESGVDERFANLVKVVRCINPWIISESCESRRCMLSFTSPVCILSHGE